MQALIYKEARAVSGMSSQMTIHAIRRVCAARKVAKQRCAQNACIFTLSGVNHIGRGRSLLVGIAAIGVMLTGRERKTLQHWGDL